MHKIIVTHPVFDFYPEPQLIEHWELAARIFKNYEFRYEESKIEVLSDFSNIKSRIKTNKEFDGGEILVDLNYGQLNSIRNFENFELSIVLAFTNVLFLCLNISLPGSASISKIESKNGLVDSMDYSSVLFESSWSFTEKYDNWPLVQQISLEKVSKWLESLGIGLKPMAGNNIERCLFSILYFCHDSYSSFNPSIIIWISQALESFYGITNHDSIIHKLKKRILLHLGPSKQPKRINKLINEFYEYRSKFVHGDLEIMRQGADKFYTNDEIDKYYLKIIELSDFGAALVISSLQKLILNGGQEISFEEKIVYS